MSDRKFSGTMSTFGGPDDTGVSETEGLALCEPGEMVMFPSSMFLSEEEAGASGLARRLNSDYPYIAMRWDYDVTPRSWLQDSVVIVRNPENGKKISARPIDWGPHSDTKRICDLSPGAATSLNLVTDQVCEILVPLPPQYDVAQYGTICISSGHGLYVRGAAGPEPWGLDEVNSVRELVELVADELRDRKVEVMTFHDDQSHSQSENLNRIVNWHNDQQRDLDCSFHMNAYMPYTTAQKPAGMGTEVLYVTQSTLANQLSSAIASVGFVNRGAKKRTDLAFLNGTTMPSVLLETAFCDAQFDCDLYRKKLMAITLAIAATLSGKVAVSHTKKKRR